jgi:hypothetical protein
MREAAHSPLLLLSVVAVVVEQGNILQQVLSPWFILEVVNTIPFIVTVSKKKPSRRHDRNNRRMNFTRLPVDGCCSNDVFFRRQCVE